MKNILCLDFDGVICNSISECMFVAYNSYMKLLGKHESVVSGVESIPWEVSNLFRKYRYLVRPAKEYWLLVHLIFEGETEFDEEFFSSESNKQWEQLKIAEETFFTTRKELMESQFEFWCSMNEFYHEFTDAWDLIKNKYPVYIVTNKNISALKVLLIHNKINISDEMLYTFENHLSKIAALKEIAARNNCTTHDLIFVDDSPATINETKEIVPRSFLADWGYCEYDGSIKSIKNLVELV